jgi:hypothetical protein
MNKHFVILDTWTGDLDVHSETPDGKVLSPPILTDDPMPALRYGTDKGRSRLLEDIAKEGE